MAFTRSVTDGQMALAEALRRLGGMQSDPEALVISRVDNS